MIVKCGPLVKVQSSVQTSIIYLKQFPPELRKNYKELFLKWLSLKFEYSNFFISFYSRKVHQNYSTSSGKVHKEFFLTCSISFPCLKFIWIQMHKCKRYILPYDTLSRVCLILPKSLALYGNQLPIQMFFKLSLCVNTCK